MSSLAPSLTVDTDVADGLRSLRLKPRLYTPMAMFAGLSMLICLWLFRIVPLYDEMHKYAQDVAGLDADKRFELKLQPQPHV